MKSLSFPIVLLTMAVGACSAPSTVTTVASPVPAPVATRSQPAEVTSVPAVRMSEAPKNWQLLDEKTDGIPGISANRAMSELLAGKAAKQTVLVAVIDNGIDTLHADLKANLWTDPATGQHGWNFIGGADGKDVTFDTFEVTREYARCHGKAAASGSPAITDKAKCADIDAAYQKQRAQIEKTVQNYRDVNDLLTKIVPMLAKAANVPADSVTPERVRAIKMATPQITQARQIFLELASEGATPSVIEDGLKSLEGQLEHSLNPDFNPRTIVGDDYTNTAQRNYGNRDVMGIDPKHGTHVAGIIGAVRGNNIGIDGIAPAVKIMMIRTVPDGDERDKDVANAIRFAADHGAKVISMSFGKAYSPYKSAVDEAVKYADSKGILMVHAAGNDGADLAKGHNFPTPEYTNGGRPQNWIEVGASSWKGGDSLAAPFSNYGSQLVDVFAPGVDILSTVPGNEYERDSGTSMAAPVVTGLAALIMDYYPNLTAADVRKVILASVTKLGSQSVTQPRPGQEVPEKTVPFGTLSVTGGIVNAYNAIKMADEMSRAKMQP
jgi:subtilisin family serine protease